MHKQHANIIKYFQIGVFCSLSVAGNDIWEVQKITSLICVREI